MLPLCPTWPALPLHDRVLEVTPKVKALKRTAAMMRSVELYAVHTASMIIRVAATPTTYEVCLNAISWCIWRPRSLATASTAQCTRALLQLAEEHRPALARQAEEHHRELSHHRPKQKNGEGIRNVEFV